MNWTRIALSSLAALVAYFVYGGVITGVLLEKQKIGSGESMFAPPNMPMQLTNNGSGIRRALFIIIHDAAQPDGYHVSTWQPTGACDR